ncbi:MAG: RNA-binding protein [Bdellovibrio sp. ArHS]|uniref:KH domain-containing protein n=1 Tax=Bdellovibrio sp. ArHS TaxID=1569284 RepID=UPI000582B81B|nr:KH domain-containing protein [Bdellovibrio sp. ArHS]KHD88392.1 MAG: RNA-binding protein [Bdellovibrio sp. ArHS]
MLTDTTIQENAIRERLAKVLQSVIQEMTSCQDNIEVTFNAGEKTTIYKVILPQEFRGKLIGSQGKNITALRNIIGAMAGNHGFRAIIELVV